MLLSLNCAEDRGWDLVSLKLEVLRKFGFLWKEFPIPKSPPPRLRPGNPLLSTISTQSAVRSRHFELPPLAWAVLGGPKTRSTLGLSLSGVTLEACVGGSEKGAAIRKWSWLVSSCCSTGNAEWTYSVGVGTGELVGETDDSKRVSWTGLEETWYSCVASLNPFFFISFNCCWANRYLQK